MKVTFDNVYNAFQIIAPKGTMISFTGEPTALADGVYLVGDDGIINLDEQFLTDTLYLSTEGTDYAVTGGMRVTYPLGDETVIIRAGSSTIPFSKGAKGGGGSGGDNTHYKGTTTTPISNGSTTNPITIDGEEYTAVFGDIVVYGYTEFVFDGSAWSEFGRPFDTTPTSGSANAVTSDGIYQRTPFMRGTGFNSAISPGCTATKSSAIAFGDSCNAKGTNSFVAGGHTNANENYSCAFNSYTTASGTYSAAFGSATTANQSAMMAIGKYNSPRTGDLFNVGNGSSNQDKSNIVEVNSTEFNVNGDIKKNNVSLPTPYTTMPTITAEMLGQIAQYVGETTNDYVKGYFYIASSDGAAEPTYSWVHLPTQNGYSETVLYTASSPHKTDVELSQAYTNFDEIVIIWKYSYIGSLSDYPARYETTKLTSQMNTGDIIIIWEGSVLTNAYVIHDSTHLNFVDSQDTIYSYLAKVIGISYGSNGGAVATPVRSLAKSEEKPIEEELVKEEEPVEDDIR